MRSAENAGTWPVCGEMDIMENVGYRPTRVRSSIQCGEYNHRIGNHKFKEMTILNDNRTFHTYGLDWTSEKLRFFVDDIQYFVYEKDADWTYNTTWPFDTEFNIIINNAIGGSWGGAKGVDESIFPTHYIIDYVRHYTSPNYVG